MDLITTWKVNSLQVKNDYNGLQDVVFTVNYSIVVQSTDPNPQRSESMANIVLGPPGSSTFILFPDLTEQEVIGWVKNQLGPAQVAAAEDILKYQVIYNSDPAGWSNPPLPWVQ